MNFHFASFFTYYTANNKYKDFNYFKGTNKVKNPIPANPSFVMSA